MSYRFQQWFLEKVYYCIRFNFNEDIALEIERKSGWVKKDMEESIIQKHNKGGLNIQTRLYISKQKMWFPVIHIF